MCGGCFCLFSNAFSISHDIEELIEKTCEKESLFSNTFSIVTVIEKVVENERLRLKAFRPFQKKFAINTIKQLTTVQYCYTLFADEGRNR